MAAFPPRSDLRRLFDSLPQVGTVTWIGVRPVRRGELVEVEEARLSPADGLAGDHAPNARERRRQVTLIQDEHLGAVASLVGRPEVHPGLVRRNVVVRGINLLALHDRAFLLGEALLEGTGLCHPCSRMEENPGPGGYNAMRGHGGITARILRAGTVRRGDRVRLAVPGEATPGVEERPAAPAC